MKFLTLVAFLTVFVGLQLSYGQSKPGPGPTFNHAAVCVHDLKVSTAFYHTVLGLQELPNPFNDGIHSWFRIGPGLQLHVIQRDCAPIVNKNIHLCFSVASLSAFMAHLDKLNVPFTNLKGDSKQPTARIDGVKQIYLQNPDGYWIEINDDR